MIQPIGYLKLYRELAFKPIWENSTPEQKVVLITLLMMANFREKQWEWQGKQFSAKPGQFVTSLENIAQECGKGITVQNVRTSLKRFEKLNFLTNESTKTGRLITIVNWELYQSEDEKLTNLSTKTSQRANKDLTTKEEGKKEKRKECLYTPPKKNKFHNFETQAGKYTNEELEHILGIRKPIKEGDTYE